MISDRIVALTTTVGKMQRRQLLGIVKRQTKSAGVPYVPVPLDEKYESITDSQHVDVTPVLANTRFIRNILTKDDREYLHQRLESLKRGRVTFLNRSVEIEGDPPFSIPPLTGELHNFPRLWTIKLLSLEPASWLALASDDPELSVVRTLVTWLTCWRSSDISSIGSAGYLRRYWTPYAVSRRICNLARLMAVMEELSFPADDWMTNHLSKNVWFLIDNIEYDVGGNHLLENGCALIVGGVLLDDDTVIRRGLDILSEELPSQLLGDGMHFERSAMYHTILLYRLAWSLDTLRRSDRKIPSDIASNVQSMGLFLHALAPRDADFPLLNDSVRKECPSRPSCLAIVDRVFEMPPEHKSTLGGESGYFTVTSGDLTILVDGGVPCPDHLPGHAHNDVGNVVIWNGTEPIITDTGVYDYQPGCRRDYARSVAAHNTIQIGDTDQTVTHGRFLMGPRPEPKSEYISSESGRGVRVRYDAPTFIRSYTHERLVEPIYEGLRIQDQIKTDEARVTARFHLAPGSDTIVEADRVKVTTPMGASFTLTINGIDSITPIETEYYPEYGVSVRRPSLEATATLMTDEICLTHKLRLQ